MQALIQQLRASAEQAIQSVADSAALEAFRVRFLARKGEVAALFDQMKQVQAADRPAMGKLLNDLRTHVQGLYDAAQARLGSGPATARASLDPTLPARSHFCGTRHPLTQTLDEIRSIFVGMGFSVASGPELEDDDHNFGALNFPPDHPARDMQDTFFVSKTALLRTHTSPVQVRLMEQQRPPIRAIMAGKVYRNEAINARSYCMFHQVEGLCVDKGVSFSDLKGTLISFIKQYYGSGLKYRFRPTFFPFTEPSADIYITCFLCGGKGCRICKQQGWLEILGCGMVHPNVLQGVGIDPEVYTGYAFGMGIERIAILRYGIDDIRLFFENDVRFLDQF